MLLSGDVVANGASTDRGMPRRACRAPGAVGTRGHWRGSIAPWEGGGGGRWQIIFRTAAASGAARVPRRPILPGYDGPAVPAPTPVLLGYADRFSAQPGETIRFMVSCEATAFSARLFRLIHGDDHPAGPGYRRIRVPSSVDGAYPGTRQVRAAGSYVRIPVAGALDLTSGVTVQAWIWSTAPSRAGGQAILACWSAAEQRGVVLGLDDAGRLSLELGFGSGRSRLTHMAEPLPPWRWTFVAATFDAATGLARLYQAAAEPARTPELVRHDEQLEASQPLNGLPPDLLLAAREVDAHRRPAAVFNGKIDRPKLFNRALDPEAIGRLRDVAAPLPPGLLGAWDFSADIRADTVRDTSGRGLHGSTVNLPTRAVTDHTWRGEEVRWGAAPDQYAAIHFHDDDLEDAGWQPSFELVVPDGLRSGVYAVHLEAEHGEEDIPFFVRPRSGTATARWPLSRRRSRTWPTPTSGCTGTRATARSVPG